MPAKNKTRILTGITTTGTPHLGNYVGAIRPAIEASKKPDVESFFFLADYHALIKCDDPARIQQSTLEIAASWLACGLDPEKVYFYRQSDIPEIPELTWLLTCVTAKGLLNRAHAYKAAVDQNRLAREGTSPLAQLISDDDGVTAGLFMYPVLMAADILIFNANKVPVGRDQVQHIEMARDIGQRFNHIYGSECFTLPQAAIEENVATLPGLDGRKMSKSYDNTIPLFAGGEKALNKAIMEIVTDSSRPGKPEDVQGSALYQLIGAFADNVHEEVAKAFHRSNPSQAGWGTLKKHAIESINHAIGGYRDKYEQLISNPEKIEEILQRGAKRARVLAQKRMAQLREAVGLRSLTSHLQNQVITRSNPNRLGRFAVFKSELGFQFRFFASDGEELLLSEPFGTPQEANNRIGQLKKFAATPNFFFEPGEFKLKLTDRGFEWLDGSQTLAIGSAANRQVLIDKFQKELYALASSSP